jgi:hypothetical protein
MLAYYIVAIGLPIAVIALSIWAGHGDDLFRPSRPRRSRETPTGVARDVDRLKKIIPATGTIEDLSAIVAKIGTRAPEDVERLRDQWLARRTVESDRLRRTWERARAIRIGLAIAWIALESFALFALWRALPLWGWTPPRAVRSEWALAGAIYAAIGTAYLMADSPHLHRLISAAAGGLDSRQRTADDMTRLCDLLNDTWLDIIAKRSVVLRHERVASTRAQEGRASIDPIS